MTSFRITLTTKTTIIWHGVQRSVKQHTFHFDNFLKKDLSFSQFSSAIFNDSMIQLALTNNTHTLIRSFNQCILHSRLNFPSDCKCNITHKYPPHLSSRNKLRLFNSYVGTVCVVSLKLGFFRRSSKVEDWRFFSQPHRDNFPDASRKKKESFQGTSLMNQPIIQESLYIERTPSLQIVRLNRLNV